MNKPFMTIEGPIGVGKSSLAHKFRSNFNFYEKKRNNTENPFLSSFYEYFKWSFQTEMLSNRYKQFQDVNTTDEV